MTISSALGITSPSSLKFPARHGHFLDGHPGPGPRGDAGSSAQPHEVDQPQLAGPGRQFRPAQRLGGWSINVTIGGKAEIDFGFDLTNPGVFLLDTTQFGLTAQIDATNLSFSASIGAIGVSVGPGRSRCATVPGPDRPP